MAKKMVVGNWKLHGSIGQIKTVLGDLAKAGVGPNVGVCVPFPYIMLAKDVLDGSRIQVGAQDVSQYHIGAYTGEVSAAMLADVNAAMSRVSIAATWSVVNDATWPVFSAATWSVRRATIWSVVRPLLTWLVVRAPTPAVVSAAISRVSIAAMPSVLDAAI